MAVLQHTQHGSPKRASKKSAMLELLFGKQGDIFETTGPLRWLCAVNANIKYRDSIELTATAQPLATMSNGTGYTGRMFNDDIKHLLKGKVDLSQGPITSHSFRAGLATMMAKARCTDKDIRLTGRWTSTARDLEKISKFKQRP